MNTDQLVKYIIDLLSIKVESEYSILEINSEVTTMTDPKAYLKFLENKMEDDFILYKKGFQETKTGFQKFKIYTKQYRDIEIEAKNADRIEKMGSIAERLADKVRAIDTIVLNGIGINFEWEGFKTNGEHYFTAKECIALSTIGTPITCVRIQRQVSGRDMLCERLEELFVERVMYPQLEAPTTQNNLIANLVKEVRT